MRCSEWLALGYFSYLVVAAWIRTLPRGRGMQVMGGSLIMCAGVWIGARTGSAASRDWAPLIYVLVGYYLPERLFVRPMPRIERWLMTWDRALLGDPVTRFADWPGLVRGYLDVVYLFCFALIPAGFATLVLTGHASLADRYWTTVLGAEFSAFATLAIVQTRPPWALDREADVPDRGIRRVSAALVRRATIGANTFPSGHTAGSLAIALVLLPVVPWAGLAFLLAAASIAVGCVAGRYHYVVDAVAGVAVAIVLWVGVSLLPC